MKKVKFTTNPYGIEVRQWCASCRHRELTRTNMRFCALRKKLVRPCDGCPQWEMNRALGMVGLSQGRVKRREYFLYLLRIREEEQQQGVKPEDEKPFELIQAEFENQYGSIYERI